MLPTGGLDSAELISRSTCRGMSVPHSSRFPRSCPKENGASFHHAAGMSGPPSSRFPRSCPNDTSANWSKTKRSATSFCWRTNNFGRTVTGTCIYKCVWGIAPANSQPCCGTPPRSTGSDVQIGDYVCVEGATQLYNGTMQMIATRVEAVDDTSARSLPTTCGPAGTTRPSCATN